MTDTTSVQQLTRDTRVSSLGARPGAGMGTVLAQAAAGAVLGSFAVVIARVLLVYNAYENVIFMTRWRQTDVAVTKLKEELRYYLID